MPLEFVITHLNSGPAMAGSYSDIKRSQRLASILAQIDWRREVDRISRRELTATRQVVEAYNEALAEARGGGGDRVTSGKWHTARRPVPGTISPASTRRYLRRFSERSCSGYCDAVRNQCPMLLVRMVSTTVRVTRCRAISA
jgi:hypothetical protein